MTKPKVAIITQETVDLIRLRAARRDLLDWRQRYSPLRRAWWERSDPPVTSGLPVEILRLVDDAVQRIDAEIERFEGSAP